jgi:hypothetical protein
VALPEVGHERSRRLRIAFRTQVGNRNCGSGSGEHAAGGGADRSGPADDQSNFAVKRTGIVRTVRLEESGGFDSGGSND